MKRESGLQAERKYLFPEAYREVTRIVHAELGGDVGLWGGLALALMELEA